MQNIIGEETYIREFSVNSNSLTIKYLPVVTIIDAKLLNNPKQKNKPNN